MIFSWEIWEKDYYNFLYLSSIFIFIFVYFSKSSLFLSFSAPS